MRTNVKVQIAFSSYSGMFAAFDRLKILKLFGERLG